MAQKRKGFTLIELLVVLFIIGLLATLVIVNVSSARVTARDTKRKANLKTIQNAIEMYNQRTGRYPISGGSRSSAWNQGGNPGTQNWIPDYYNSTYNYNWSTPYISGIQPHDPIETNCWPWGNCGKAGDSSVYEYWSNGDRYLLAVRLENTDDPERNEITKIQVPNDCQNPQRSYTDYWTSGADRNCDGFPDTTSNNLGKYAYVLAN